MSTRSDIIAECSDGKWRRIYCHFDGYLAGVGQTLFDHYTTQEKVEQLMALGDLSSLHEEIGVKHDFDGPSYGNQEARAAYDKKYGKMCQAYGRDRGETDVEAKVFDTIQAAWPPEDTWTEFTYVWMRNGDQAKWFVASADHGSQALVDLGDALLGRVDVGAVVKVPFIGVIGAHKKLATAAMPTLDQIAKK